ncbi:Uncharacterised protein g3502 [Pycnogonum litorale]
MKVFMIISALVVIALCIPSVHCGFKRKRFVDKAGSCPSQGDFDCTGYGLDYERCIVDDHCRGNLKCCNIYCKMKCTKPTSD